MVTLLLIRGLPGSGKTTLAEVLQPDPALRFSVDDFFVNGEGVYVWDGALLREAHEGCLKRVKIVMREANDGDLIVVRNTFVRREHMQPYINEAFRLDMPHWSADLFDGGWADRALARRNVHGVPEYTIRRMRQVYER